MKPDDICREYSANKKITIQIEEDMIIIEGEAEALEFVGHLILAQARFDDDCSFFIGPKTAGRIFFTSQSSHGIYIHRLPCLEDHRMDSAH